MVDEDTNLLINFPLIKADKGYAKNQVYNPTSPMVTQGIDNNIAA